MVAPVIQKSHSKGYSGIPELYIAGGDYGLLVQGVYLDGVSHLTVYCNFDVHLWKALHELSVWNYLYPRNYDPPKASFWYTDESLCFYGWAESISTVEGMKSILSDFYAGDKYLTLILRVNE